MKGRMIITPMSEEALRTGTPRPGEIASGVNVDTKLTGVSAADRFSILNGVADALNFTKKDWLYFIALLFGGGLRSETYAIDRRAAKASGEEELP